jgi:hypothetical protein
MGLGQIRSTCLDNHASGVLARLLECLVKASGKFLEFIVLASFTLRLLNQVARVHRKRRMLDEKTKHYCHENTNI